MKVPLVMFPWVNKMFTQDENFWLDNICKASLS